MNMRSCVVKRTLITGFNLSHIFIKFIGSNLTAKRPKAGRVRVVLIGGGGQHSSPLHAED